MKASSLLLPLLFAACTDATQSGAPVALVIVDGDGQVGTAGHRLLWPLEVAVVTADGSPADGVIVRWMALQNGTVDRRTSTTDDHGHAIAWFTLGATEGPAAAVAEIQTDSAIFSLAARTDPPVGEPRYGELRTLEPPTFDGSGQTVHPDYVLHGDKGFGFPQHLAITPYPFGDPRKELPSVFGAEEVLDWMLPPRAPNPVVPAPASGYMSDPDIAYVPSAGELWLYYRQVTTRNIVHLIRTADGITWSAPVEVLSAPNHGIISPAVVRRGDGDWWMWYIDGGTSGCSGSSTTVMVTRSPDGIHWGDPRPLAMSHDGMYPWHIDVQWIAERGEFWALYNSKRPGNCATPAVFLATSSDGVQWKHLPTPVLAKGEHPDLADIVYRGTFHYDHARMEVTFWFSGATYRNGHYEWHSVVQRRRLEDVLGLAAEPDPTELEFTDAPAELVDWP